MKLLSALQHSLIYFPTRELLSTPEDIGLAFESVSLTTSDGVRVHGWWIPQPTPTPRGTVLFLHGNAGNISHRLETLATLASLGMNVLLIDYRGFGKSQGEPSEEGTYRDADAAWAWLHTERGIPPEEIVIMGRSLGGGVATWLALQRPAAGVILESTFTSIPALVEDLYPVPFLGRFVAVEYDNLARVPDLGVPLLVIHSRDDELIPLSHGQQLFNAAGDPKRFLEIRFGHGDGFVRTGEPYVRGLDAFFKELFG